jgi:hypothetical protein
VWSLSWWKLNVPDAERVCAKSASVASAVLHPKKHIFMHASKVLCRARGVVEALSWDRGVWRVPTRTGVGEYLRESGREAIEESAEASEVPVTSHTVNPVPMKNTYRP